LLTAVAATAHNRDRRAMRSDDRLDRLPDAELVARVREQNDRQAFEQLYLRHRRRVLALLLGLLRDPAAAEDLCHDCFLKAWSGIGALRGELQPWLLRIASNLALNQFRRRSTHRRLEVEIAPPHPEPLPERAAAAREEGRLAAEILSALGFEQRQVMTLRYLDGLSHAEIVTRTGYDEPAVRSHLQNGRRNFRIAWQRRTAGAEGNP
jgi:RNA polymerase sigma-70 factor (ECF subfamily)